MTVKNKKILIIIGGGIAAYKSLDLIRLLKKNDNEVKTILTKSGKEFVTPLSVSSLTKSKIFENIFPNFVNFFPKFFIGLKLFYSKFIFLCN